MDQRAFRKLALIAVSCGMALLLSSCSETGSIGEFQSVTGLYNSCPGKCGEPLACENEIVHVWGFLDQHNVFANPAGESERERFLIAEGLDSQGFASGNRIEVFPPQGGNNAALFDHLDGVDESSKILVTGTVKGFDAPTNLTCERLISLEIRGEEDLTIDQ